MEKIIENTKKYREPLILWLFSSFIVVVAAIFGSRFLIRGNCSQAPFGYSGWFSEWDGQWYNLIADKGYSIDNAGQVFFPLYPLIGRIFHWISGMSIEYSLVTISWVAAALFSCIWLHYCRAHPKKTTHNIEILSLALILFWPASYFLRDSYTESLFMLLLALLFIGMAKKWDISWMILICILITATRPTGVICSVVLALHVWLRLKEKQKDFSEKLFIAGTVGIISAWGLYSYMLYLQITLGDAMLFAERQSAFNNFGNPPNAFFVRFWEMISLRPIWGFLVNGDISILALPLDIQNRITWILAWVFLLIGRLKRWLTAEETLFCVLSLLMFYYSSAPRNMFSVGRYVYTLLPIFLVMGRMLEKIPVSIQLCVIAFLAAFLFLNTGMFTVFYCMF